MALHRTHRPRDRSPVHTRVGAWRSALLRRVRPIAPRARSLPGTSSPSRPQVQLLEKKSLPRLDLPKIRKDPLVEIIPLSTGESAADVAVAGGAARVQTHGCRCRVGSLRPVPTRGLFRFPWPRTATAGCLGACTYCKTKHARGHLGSYEPDAIVARAKRVVRQQGVKEIWLSSEDTGEPWARCQSLERMDAGCPSLLPPELSSAVTSHRVSWDRKGGERRRTGTPSPGATRAACHAAFSVVPRPCVPFLQCRRVRTRHRYRFADPSATRRCRAAVRRHAAIGHDQPAVHLGSSR